MKTIYQSGIRPSFQLRGKSHFIASIDLAFTLSAIALYIRICVCSLALVFSLFIFNAFILLLKITPTLKDATEPQHVLNLFFGVLTMA